MSQFPSQGEKENPLKTAPIKDTVADSDGVVLVDGQDVGTKRVLWSTIKSALGQIFAPLTRKINNKALSSDVVLTGDDIATSATDGTTISSSLSNAVKGKFSLYQDPLTDFDMEYSSVTMDLLLSTLPSNSVMIAGVTSAWTAADLPATPSTLVVVNRYSGRKFALLFSNIGSEMWFGTAGASFNGWKPVAIATPPQEFDLPLANGIENGGNTSAYWKSQEGIVFVRFSVMKAGSHHQNNDVFATLPEGFRPKQRILFAGIGDLISAGTGVIAAEIAINTNGTMQLVYANSAPTWIMGEAVFIAAD